MPKPVCTKCQRFFHPKKVGTPFIEMMPRDGVLRPPPGTEAPEQWKPYKLWIGDLWECRGCGAEIVVGAASKPIREHYQHDFPEMVAALDAKITVNDC